MSAALPFSDRSLASGEAASVLEQIGQLRVDLVSYALRRGARGRPDAEDAAQEAICRALERSVSGGYFEAWLHVVARNFVADDLRYKRRFQATEPGEELAGSEIDELGRIEDADVIRVVQSAIFSLPPKQRRAVQAIAGGETVAQFSTREGISRRSVEGHLRRARLNLRRLFTD